MKLEDLLNDLGKKLGVDPIPKTKDGVYRIQVTKSNFLNFEPSLDNIGFYLYSVIGRVRPNQEKEVYKEALAGNLFGTQTGKAGLGCAVEKGLLILFQTMEEKNLEQVDFEEQVTLFCQYLFFWIEKLSRLQESDLGIIPLQRQFRGLKETSDLKIFFA